MAPQVPPARIQARDAIVKIHKIQPRMSWGTRTPVASKQELDWNYTAVAIHHSGNWGEKNPAGIEKKHMVENGWGDVGYHYMVHPNGTIYEGCEIVYKGTHVRGQNTGKIGILMMGDFDHQWWDFDDTLTKKHLATMKELVVTLQRYFPLTKLGGHKEYLPSYNCPGSALMSVIGQVRTSLSLSAP